MKKKSVAHRMCKCGRRGFLDEHDAEKALGRAQGKRARMRGARTESRIYWCEEGEMFHLTSMSHKTYREMEYA